MRQIRTHAGRAGKYNLNARAFPCQLPRPSSRLRRETPGFAGCAERRSRFAIPTISLVVLPHDWRKTPALHWKASPSCATCRLCATGKPGVSRRFAAPTGGGCAPHYGTGAWAPIFAGAKISLRRPPAHAGHPLGRVAGSGAAARCLTNR